MVDTIVLDTIKCEGSSPSICKIRSSLIGRVSSCHGEWCGFESRLQRILNESSLMVKMFVFKTKDKGSNPFFLVLIFKFDVD